jgi:hypothetical protein
MTLAEAVIQARMELGSTREEAVARMARHTASVPMGAKAASAELEPGHEREFIEGYKKAILYVEARPNLAKALREHMERSLARIIEEN